MAAPFARMCLRKLALSNKYGKIKRCQFHPLCTQAATKSQSQGDTILVPKKIKRDDLAVLRALESTIEYDPSNPHYMYMDDPYLLPQNPNHKLNNDLAYISGVKAAQYVKDNYPEPFMVRPMEDFSYTRPGFQFKPTPEFSKDSVEGLQERIEMERTVDAYECYTGLQEKGIEVPHSLKVDLLELLCFYNSADPPIPPQPLENLHRTQDMTYRFKTDRNWRGNDLADQMFQSLEHPDQRAYAAMLRGKAKHGDTEGALRFFEKMKAENMQVGLKEYNAVLKAYLDHPENQGKTIDSAKKILEDMHAADIDPDLDTFNTILLILCRSKSSESKPLTLNVLQEMIQCGVEPSLGSYHIMLHTCLPKRGIQAQLVWDVLEQLEGKDLEMRHVTDYNFFPDVMKRCEFASDIKIAKALHKILMHGKNRRLLAQMNSQQAYFNSYLLLVFVFDELEGIMDTYYKFVPHTFIPNADLFLTLVRSLSLHKGYHYMPGLWTDIFRFCDPRHAVKIIAYLLKVMSGTQDDKMQNMFMDIVGKTWDMSLSSMKFRLTGGMLGDMCQISINAKQHDLAWKYFEENYNSRKSITGFMGHATLGNLATILINQRDVPKLQKVCTVLGEMVAPNLESVISQMKAKLELTEQEISFLDSLDK